jgi:hypothetical protein
MNKGEILEDKFMTSAKFSQEVEKIASCNEMNYIDAILHYCDINSIEVETVSKLITKPLKEKLKCDAQQLNYMKKTSKAKLVLV